MIDGARRHGAQRARGGRRASRLSFIGAFLLSDLLKRRDVQRVAAHWARHIEGGAGR
jgi:hypothetical protein